MVGCKCKHILFLVLLLSSKSGMVYGPTSTFIFFQGSGFNALVQCISGYDYGVTFQGSSEHVEKLKKNLSHPCRTHAHIQHSHPSPNIIDMGYSYVLNIICEVHPCV